MNDIYQSDAMDLIEFANEWAALGDAIQVQVTYVVNHNFIECTPEDFDHDEVNENAIREARTRLDGYNAEIDEAISSYFSLLKRTKREQTDEVAEKARVDLIAGAIEDDPGEAGEIAAAKGDEDQGVTLVISGSTEEWCVQYWYEGQLHPQKCYYTGDFDDAIETRDAMAKEAMEKNGLVAFCPKHPLERRSS